MSDYNLISEKELALLKIKLGKSKRNEKDWSVIKEMLLAHDLIVPELLEESNEMGNINGAMYIDNYLIAFTNPDDCSRQMQSFSQDYMMTLRWQLGIRSFVEMAHIADQTEKILCIDLVRDGRTRFITYSKGRVEATFAW